MLSGFYWEYGNDDWSMEEIKQEGREEMDKKDGN